MSSEFIEIASKLKRCTENLQLTIQDVSSDLGLPVDYLLSIESGQSAISGDDILILADFYKEDFKYFITRNLPSGSEQTEILFRKYTDSFSKKDRIAIQEFIYLCECEQYILDELEVKFKIFEFKPEGKYYKSHGEEAAKKLRTFLGYKNAEILDNVFDELRKTGIHIFRRRLENSGISGLFIKHPIAGKCVLINYNEDIYRQNFTLAHEIGHAIFDSDSELNNVSFISDKYDMKEVRANAFASNFLIPPQAILDLKVSNWTIEIVKKVANQLHINVMPLVITLKTLNQISEYEFNQLKRSSLKLKTDLELNKLTAKQATNRKILLDKGLSSFYVRKCHEAYEKGIISERRLAELLLVEDNEVNSILNLLNLQLDYSI